MSIFTVAPTSTYTDHVMKEEGYKSAVALPIRNCKQTVFVFMVFAFIITGWLICGAILAT